MVSPVTITKTFNGDTAAANYVNAAALDTQLTNLASTVNAEIAERQRTVRDGSGLAPQAVTYASLHPQVTSLLVAGGVIPKQAAATVGLSNTALAGLLVVDSYTLVANDRVLLTAQMNSVENGLWVAAAGAWTRPTDSAAGSSLAIYTQVGVTRGASYPGSLFILAAASTVGSTAQTWYLFSAASPQPANLSSLSVIHSSTLITGENAAAIVNNVTVPLNANIANSALAVNSIVNLSSAAANPSYYVAMGGELDVLDAANTNLQFSTLYGMKGILNFKSSSTTGTCAQYLIAGESETIITMSQTSGTTHINQVFGFQVISGPFSTAAGGTTIIDTYVGLYVPAIVISGAGTTTITNRWNAFFAEPNGASYFASGGLCVGTATIVTGGINHVGVGGIRTAQVAAQDGIQLLGRGGGASSFVQSITSAALTASRTTTLPDAPLTIASITTKGAVTQITSRTTPVTLNAIAGDITLVSAAGAAAWNSFLVNNTSCAAGDIPIVIQRSGTDLYSLTVTNVINGQFKITFIDVTGVTVEQPVFSFIIHKFSAS